MRHLPKCHLCRTVGAKWCKTVAEWHDGESGEQFLVQKASPAVAPDGYPVTCIGLIGLHVNGECRDVSQAPAAMLPNPEMVCESTKYPAVPTS